jgi:hypothetical protein
MQKTHCILHVRFTESSVSSELTVKQRIQEAWLDGKFASTEGLGESSVYYFVTFPLSCVCFIIGISCSGWPRG